MDDKTRSKDETQVRNNYHVGESPGGAIFLKMFETPTIDVHGLTSEEALKIVRANLRAFKERGYPEVFIVHGKGQGILREKIRDFLRTVPYIRGYRRGRADEGGDGVSVVVF